MESNEFINSYPILPLIVMPNYNNKNVLREVVIKSLNMNLPVLVSDDGSTDGSPDTIKDLPTTVIISKKNRGKGAAIKSAADYAVSNNFSHIITLDADNQHDPEDISKFIKIINENPDAVIIGVRNMTKANSPKSSRFGRKFSNFWIKAACGESVADSQSGFRAYPLHIFKTLKFNGEHFDFEVEVIVRSAWAGLSIKTVPISVKYDVEKIEKSKFHPLIDNMRISWMYTKLVSRNLFPLPHKKHYKKNKSREKIDLKKMKAVMKELLYERTTPKEIAAAASLGMFFGVFPVICCHSITIIFVATRLRLNRIIALNISHLCAPPFVPAISLMFGYYLRNGKFLTEFNIKTLGYQISDRFLDYLIGAIVLSPIAAFFTFFLTYFIVIIYKRFRTKKGKCVRDEKSGI